MGGGVHFTPEQLMTHLRELGIETRTIFHAPVFTVDEARRVRGRLSGGHCKSLFLRDKKRHLWLLVALEHRKLDFKQLRYPLEASSRLSFGSPELLLETLGVTPGSVTPFALINDREHRVTVALDRAMLEVSPLHYHPLINDRTSAIAPEDLLRFLESTGHRPLLLELS